MANSNQKAMPMHCNNLILATGATPPINNQSRSIHYSQEAKTKTRSHP
jgi:hypothetical protein